MFAIFEITNKVHFQVSVFFFNKMKMYQEVSVETQSWLLFLASFAASDIQNFQIIFRLFCTFLWQIQQQQSSSVCFGSFFLWISLASLNWTDNNTNSLVCNHQLFDSLEQKWHQHGSFPTWLWETRKYLTQGIYCICHLRLGKKTHETNLTGHKTLKCNIIIIIWCHEMLSKHMKLSMAFFVYLLLGLFQT